MLTYDEMIEEKKEQKQKLLDQMEIKKESYLDELSKFTIKWFEKETLSTIKSNADKVVELGEDKARELKNETEQLKDKTPELVRQYMDEEHLWWHSNEDKESYYSYDHRILDKHEKKIKLMFGELGSILFAYDLVEIGSEYNRNYSSSWTREGFSDNSTLRYGYGLSYSDELYTINKEYLELVEKAQKVNEQIAEIEDKKKRENVEDWWESL